MANQLYNQMMGGGNQQNNFLQRFNQFRQNFSGDPQQQIQRMLNSGQITQDQYNRAVQQAQNIMRMLGR